MFEFVVGFVFEKFVLELLLPNERVCIKVKRFFRKTERPSAEGFNMTGGSFNQFIVVKELSETRYWGLLPRIANELVPCLGWRVCV